MKTHYLTLSLSVVVSCLTVFGFSDDVSAAVGSTQVVTLSSGWNIVSTPKVLDSHSFSVLESATNFDIYVLDASQTSGWATLADLGQTEFEPLFGYFINNKTGTEQTLTFNFKIGVSPNEKLFERTFSTAGWYSIGVANDEYAKRFSDERADDNNPSNILSLLEGKHDHVIDFTDAVYEVDKNSLALSDPWKAAAPGDVNTLNDFRDTKGYAIYIKEVDARYNGFQNEATAPATTTLTIGASSADPDSTTIGVEEETTSDWKTIFAFDLDADDSTQDIEVNTLKVIVETGTAIFEDVVDDVQLVVNGEIYDDLTIANSETTTATLTFEIDDNLVIEAGEEISVELQIDFKALVGNYENGETIYAYTDASGWEAGSVGEVEVLGSATGETHALQIRGIILEPGDINTDTQGENDTFGIFSIDFDVTAFDDDFYIAEHAATTTSLVAVNGGAKFTVEGPVGFLPGSSTISGVLSSTADEDTTGVFTVSEGETETFTLTVAVDPNVVGLYRVSLDDVLFTTTSDGTSGLTTDQANPASDYRTSFLNINN